MKTNIVYVVLCGLVNKTMRMCGFFNAERVKKMIKLGIEGKPPEQKLKMLFDVENYLYFLEGNASVEYGKGIHTKHKHTNYHNYFVKNINFGESVLDVGCGKGTMSYAIVTGVENAKVVGIEINDTNYIFACEHYKHKNLKFVQGDILEDLPENTFDVIVLSNVLEHIDDRVEFLIKLLNKYDPKRFIIRVPVFERDWRVPLKKELGLEYRLDSGHKVEYTKEGYLREVKQAGLKILDFEVCWGEIWSVLGRI